ncbi:MAG TPA: PQQ-dependent sugar dehydrogenase [Natronosporangium sp.]
MRPSRFVAAACASVLLGPLLAGCAFGEPDQADSEVAPPNFPSPSRPAGSPPPPELTDVHEVIATGLDIPWDIDFLPDGTALVTERANAQIVRVGPDSTNGELTVEPVQTIEGVNPAGEGGLLGIAVSPDYEADGLVFIYYTTDEDNRIARLELGEPPEPILTGIPRSDNHNGGQLAFGPDGYLYASTGDAQDGDRAQDRDDLAGKILRLTVDGEPAPGNPFDSPVWSYGHRNVQGLAWDEAGRLWATEFGNQRWDELNLIEAGENYGWPEVEGIGEDDRYRDPEVVWETAEASCAGAAVVGRTLVTACLRGQRLWRVDLTESGTILGAPQPMLVEEYGRLRGAAMAPDGSLWISTSNLDGRLPPEQQPDPEDDRIIQLVVSGGGGAGIA